MMTIRTLLLVQFVSMNSKIYHGIRKVGCKTKRCIVGWVQTNQSCPLCRFELPVFDLLQYLDPITIRQPRMVLGIIDYVYDPNTCNSSK